MPAICIGIDLCQNPLRVGWDSGRGVLVEQGSTGINLNNGVGEGHSSLLFEPRQEVANEGEEEFENEGEEKFEGEDDEVFSGTAKRYNPFPERKPVSQELVNCFKDARVVAKSFFGSPEIKKAVVVVPNTTDCFDSSLVEAGNSALIKVQQVVPEYVAVAAAYAHTRKPSGSAKVTIVSFTSGFCDVCVVSMKDEADGYAYTLEARECHRVEQPSGAHHTGILGPVAATTAWAAHNVAFAADPFTTAIELAVTKVLESLDKKSAFDEVVLVGNSAEVKNMRKVINRGLGHVREWKEIDDTLKAAAYGAAVLAALEKTVSF